MTSPPCFTRLREKVKAATDEALFRLGCLLGSAAAKAYVRYVKYWQVDDDWPENSDNERTQQ